MKSPVYGNIHIGFWLAIIILIAICGVSYRSTVRLVEVSRWAAKNQGIAETLDEILSDLKDIQRGERGYVITGKEIYLAPYHASIKEIEQKLKYLRGLTSDNPRQQGQINVIEPLIMDVIGHFRKTIEVRKRSGFEAAARIVRTDRGKKFTDEIVKRIEEIDIEGKDLLVRHSQAAERSARVTIFIVVSGSILAIGLVTFAGLRINKSLKERTEAEEEARDLYNNAPCGYHSIDKEGLLVQINDTELDWLGYAREEVIGKKKFPDILAAESLGTFHKNFPLLKERGWVRDIEFVMTRKDGTAFPVLLNATVIKDAAGNFLMSRSTIFDITDRKKTEDVRLQANKELQKSVGELEGRNRDITMLNTTSDLLQSCMNSEEAYQLVAKAAQQLFPRQDGALYEVNASRNFLEVKAAWGGFESAEKYFALDGCWALRRGRMHLVDLNQFGSNCGHLGLSIPKAYMCMPLMAQGETLGILHLRVNDELLSTMGSAQRYFTDTKIRMAGTIAVHIALALSNLRLRESLRSQAIRDPVTGLYNRRYMEESLERELYRSNRDKTKLGIIMLDIDHFKNLNDTFGHQAGDVLLAELGGFLRKHVRGADIACRYGGEEFILILTDTSLEKSCERAELLRKQVKNLSVIHRGQPLEKINISLGVAIFPDHGASMEAILRTVDAALYRAKAQGRDRVEVSQKG